MWFGRLVKIVTSSAERIVTSAQLSWILRCSWHMASSDNSEFKDSSSAVFPRITISISSNSAADWSQSQPIWPRGKSRTCRLRRALVCGSASTTVGSVMVRCSNWDIACRVSVSLLETSDVRQGNFNSTVVICNRSHNYYPGLCIFVTKNIYSLEKQLIKY